MSPSFDSSARRTGLALLAVTTIGWGLNWPSMKLLLQELPPMFARGTSGVVAGLVIGLYAASRGDAIKPPPAILGRLLIASFVNVFSWMGFATLAMQHLSVGQCALLVYTMPVWSTMLAWPVLGHRPSGAALAGLAMCAGGLWVLFGGQATALDPSQWASAALALTSAVLFALGTVALRPLTEMPPLSMIAWQLVLGCLPMLVLSACLEHPHPLQASLRAGLLWIYMAAVPMGLCYLSWFGALRRLPPATASVATLVTPVIGVIAAAVVLSEPLGLREGVALLLTLGGVALALFKRKAPPASASASA